MLGAGLLAECPVLWAPAVFVLGAEPQVLRVHGWIISGTAENPECPYMALSFSPPRQQVADRLRARDSPGFPSIQAPCPQPRPFSGKAVDLLASKEVPMILTYSPEYLSQSSAPVCPVYPFHVSLG